MTALNRETFNGENIEVHIEELTKSDKSATS